MLSLADKPNGIVPLWNSTIFLLRRHDFRDLYFSQTATEGHITEVVMAEYLVIGVIAVCFVVGAVLSRYDLPVR